MKIIKNRITQIVIALILITGIGFAIIYNNKPVLADDQVSMEVFNNKMKEVENKITTLEDNLNLKTENLENENKELKIEIAEQQKEIENLKTENTNLKVKIEKTNYDTDIKDINNKIKKINAREDYLYNKGSIPSTSYLPSISKYINENLK